MAKDPAFLFYYQDFLVGTTFLSMEEKGAYITLLCFLADKGSMSLEQIRKVVSDPIWKAICSKFSKDETGYYHKRLRQEVEKRKKFTASRRKNLHMEKHKDPHMEAHMENENENTNENKDINKSKNKIKKGKFVKPRVCDIQAYCDKRKNGLRGQDIFDYYEANGWVQGKCCKPVKDWKACVRTWEKNKLVNGSVLGKPSQSRATQEYEPPKPEEISDEGRKQISKLVKNTLSNIK